MPWTAYMLNAIDFGWEYLPTAQETAAKFATAEASYIVAGMPEATSTSTIQFLRDLERARDLAAEKGWEGDFRTGHEPHVLWLPGENQFLYAFVWKQDNNGDTFVVSPIPLPWLNDNG